MFLTKVMLNKISSRQQFILITTVLWIGLLSFRELPAAHFAVIVVAVTALSFVLSAAALRYGLKGVEFFTLLTLPVALTLSTALMLTTLPIDSPLWYVIWFIFWPLFYATILSENIFNVSLEKSIPLRRAANTTAFLSTVATAFLFFSYGYNVDRGFTNQLILVFGVTFILSLQYVWSLSLSERIGKIQVYASGLVAFLILQVALVASFYPLKFSTRGLLLGTILYSILGVAREHFKGQLKMRVMLEYAFVTGVVIAVIIWMGEV